MSDTPRTDRHMRGGSYSFSGEFARNLERELAHQTAQADEAVRRLALYADREEAKEIRRLHGIIAGQTVELERLKGVAECAAERFTRFVLPSGLPIIRTAYEWQETCAAMASDMSEALRP